MPDISIIIPNYNDSADLPACVERFLSQTLQPTEILIIDDGSTDQSVTVIQNLQNKHPGIKYIQHPENLGVCHAVNTGITNAKGEFIACISVTDMVDPTFLEVTHNALQEETKAAFCATSYRTLNQSTGEKITHNAMTDLGFWFCQHDQPTYLSQKDAEVLLSKRFFWPPSNGTLFRKNLVLESGGYLPTLKWHSDWYMIFYLLFKHGAVFISHPYTTFKLESKAYSAQGMNSFRQQSLVMKNVLMSFKEKAYSEFRKNAIQCPSIFSPFIKQTLFASIQHPRNWDITISVFWWWLKEILTGRRPSILRRSKQYQNSEKLRQERSAE
jgi:glycosyltransferase involved in cell wall biosynthesis